MVNSPHGSGKGSVVGGRHVPPGPKPVELSALVGKEVDYRGTFGFDDELDDALALLATTTGFDPVVTHTFALAQAREAMDTAADATTPAKVVVDLGVWRDPGHESSPDQDLPPVEKSVYPG
jgi:L-idonate 5-dehydrogenase